MAVAIRGWCYARLEEIRFRTGVAVLTGLLAVIGGAIAAVVLAGGAGRPGPAPRALAGHRALAGPPANVAYPLRSARSITREAPPPARLRRAARQARAVVTGANAPGRGTGAAPLAGRAHSRPPSSPPGRGRGRGWHDHGWLPPGWRDRNGGGWGHPGPGRGNGRGHGWGQGDGQGQGGDN